MATKQPNKAQITLMSKILDEYTEDQPFAYMVESRTAKLVDLGLVEVNLTMKDEESGGFATRLTDLGMSYFTNDESSGEPVAQSEPLTDGSVEVGSSEQGVGLNDGSGDGDTGLEGTVTGVVGGFEIDDNVPVPTVRRASGGSIYPFDALAVGQSFHVPVSEGKPNPAKSLASTVSAATKRSNGAKKFIVRSVDASDPKGPGARIFRVEVDEE